MTRARAAHWLMLAWLAFLWQAVVKIAGTHTDGAVAHGLALWHAERALHLPDEAVLAGWTAHYPSIAQTLSVVYLIAHPVAVVVLLVAIWRYRRPAYLPALAALTLLTVVCLLVSLWPVAPPVLLGVGVPAAAAGTPAHVEYQSVGTLADHVAAFPSVHVAWATWVAIWASRLGLLTKRRAYGYMTLVVAVVILGGHHTWADAITGATLAAACTAILAALPITADPAGRLRGHAPAGVDPLPWDSPAPDAVTPETAGRTLTVKREHGDSRRHVTPRDDRLGPDAAGGRQAAEDPAPARRLDGAPAAKRPNLLSNRRGFTPIFGAGRDHG